MKLKFYLYVATSLLFLSGQFLGKAHAIDIPVLTWEQGKSQSVVLGDPTGANKWDVILKSDFGVVIEFKVSRSNSADFKVYTINIPNSLPTGSYTIQTSAPNYPTTVVANVLLITQSVYEIPRAPIDLLIILCLLAILICTPSLLRSNNLRFAHIGTNRTDIQNLIDGRYWQFKEGKTLNTMEIKRAKSYNLLRPSVFKQLLLIDASHVYKYKFHAFVILPILSLSLSAILFFIQNQHKDLMKLTGLTIFIVLILISIFDLYAGLIAGMVYSTLSVVFYSQYGVRDLAQAIVISIIFVLPSMINLVGVALVSDMNKETKKSWLYSFIGASSIGSGILIVNSLDSGHFESLPFIASLSLGVYLLAGIKIHMISKFMDSVTPTDENATDAQQLVTRIVSPLTITAISGVMIMIFYNWSESLPVAIFATFFWSMPLLISIVKFENRFLNYLKKLPRNLYIELLVVTFSVIGIFYLSQMLPLLIQDRALLLMSLLALPAIFHAFYVASVESGRQMDEKVT